MVKSGKLQDPYTGKEIKFKKGAKTPTAVQIDHVVSLSDAWQKGAQKLSKSKRTELANDPYNLLAVDGSANQKKSDGDAATWLPSNTSFRCEYVARQIGVKHKYSLWVTQAEKEAMNKVLGSCPTQAVPDYTGTNAGEQPQTATAEPTQEPSSEPTQTEQPSPSSRSSLRRKPNNPLRLLKYSKTTVPMSTTRIAPPRVPPGRHRSIKVSRAIVPHWTVTMMGLPANSEQPIHS